MVCWQELFNNGITLKESTIIEVWEDAATLQEVYLFPLSLPLINNH